MNNIKFLKTALLFLVITALVSCNKKNDDKDLNTKVNLVGSWQRSDFSNEFEYTLNFSANNTGYRTEREGDLEGGGPVISNAVSFNWTVSDDLLNIDYDGDIVTTHFSANPNGQLHLPDLTDLYFIKLE